MGENTQGCNLGTGARPGPWGKKELTPWIGDHITQQRLLCNPQQSPWCFPHKFYWLTTHDSQKQDSSVVRAMGWWLGDMGFIQFCDFLQDSGWAVLIHSLGIWIWWALRPVQALTAFMLKGSSKTCIQGLSESTTTQKYHWNRSLVQILFFFWGCLLSNKIYLVIDLWLWC